ncbi:hypothetical protein JCM17960_04690 [Magnetospira thiophila]
MTGESGPLTFHHALQGAARAFALAGGMLMVALGLLTGVSILGRWLFDTPVPGDFELVQSGCAIAIFAFLPHAQMRRGHVAVDFFVGRFPVWTQRILESLGHGLFALIAALLTWRLTLGGLSFLHNGETTMILGLPLWWSFPPIVAACGLLTLTCLDALAESLRRSDP